MGKGDEEVVEADLLAIPSKKSKHKKKHAPKKEPPKTGTKVLTKVEIQVLKDAFKLFDKDNDGIVSMKDLASMLQALGQNPTDQEIKDIIHELDTDGNGQLDFEEFCALVVKNGKAQPDMEKEIMEAFKAFDANGDGIITVDEIKGMFKMIGETMSDQELQALFEEFDTNHDGKIDYSEFVKAMTSDSFLFAGVQ